MKKDAWKNNLGLKVVALLFSVILWWTVVNIDDPIDKAYYTTGVELVNTDIITNQGQSFEVVGSQEIVVTVKARRKVLEKIRTSDIVATALNLLPDSCLFSQAPWDISCIQAL